MHAARLPGRLGRQPPRQDAGPGRRAATSGQTVRNVTLTNGHTAHAVLGLVDIGALPTTTCPPTTAAGLRVFPPNQKASKVIPFPFPACGRAGGPGVPADPSRDQVI